MFEYINVNESQFYSIEEYEVIRQVEQEEVESRINADITKMYMQYA